MLPDFWRTFKINHSCDLLFIIANPTDKFYDGLQKSTNTDLVSLSTWVQVTVNLLGSKLAGGMNIEACKARLDCWIV